MAELQWSEDPARAIEQAALAGFKAGALRMVRAIAVGRLSGQGPSSLGQRSGDLKRDFLTSSAESIQKATVQDGSISADIGTSANIKYARIHEEGGVIRAKGKMLKVPLRAAQTASGVTRTRVTPYFVLVRSVTIPARKWLSGGVAENESMVIESVRKEVAKVLSP